jgi:cation diffusion facilitator CzcD-associated flavoprotein CzcO
MLPGMGLRVVVIGAGFGGLGVAHALRAAGVLDVTILERAGDVGGVWRENTYPGAACDVPSPLYSWSWAVNPTWSRRYGRQPEILDYIRRTCVDDGLRDLVRTGVEVTALEHVDGCWRVITDQGVLEADVVVTATGQLSNPAVPTLPGADSFAGPVFHSAQWRHDVDLAGRRVAVVGTGASAVQFVPGIVDEVAAMTVFQRSAPYVVLRPDRLYSPLHHRVFRRFPAVLAFERRSVYALTELFNRALEGTSRVRRPLLATIRAVWRAHLRRQVRDPELRRRLVPDYELGCKRLLFSNDWYPALDRDHVEVVTERITGIEPTGVRTADGRLHEVDVLIWGTGFAATDFLGGLDVRGAGGVSLKELWADGARAHLGITVPGFPNLFCVYGPNTNLGGSSVIGMLEAQAGWIAQVARRLQDGSAQRVAVRRDVWERYDAEMQGRLGSGIWAGCDSWYRDGRRVTTNWPGEVAEYKRRTAEVDWSELEEVDA